jgi:hypothetical protein
MHRLSLPSLENQDKTITYTLSLTLACFCSRRIHLRTNRSQVKAVLARKIGSYRKLPIIARSASRVSRPKSANRLNVNPCRRMESLQIRGSRTRSASSDSRATQPNRRHPPAILLLWVGSERSRTFALDCFLYLKGILL